MARHPDLPKNVPAVLLRKQDIFDSLKRIDSDSKARDRILAMEIKFRDQIETHIKGLLGASGNFAKFHTNPFVLMFLSKQKSYSRVSQIEQDLVLAKVFSSMETSAGNMLERIVLPVYGWEAVESAMHSHGSLLDGQRANQRGDQFVCVTLKSGPRTLNDGMVENIGKGLVENAPSWAVSHRAKQIDFTYGVLYGTKKQSNKKDWHILRNINESRSSKSELIISHKNNWSISYADGDLTVSATVRVGIEWWEFLGGKDTWIEMCCALIRSCIAPVAELQSTPNFAISDLSEILDMSGIDSGYNVALLQKSQLEWLPFLARHFSDGFAVSSKSRP